MKVAALINIVPDIETLQKDQWNVKDINHLETSYIPKTYDIYNDFILEMLLRLKQKIGKKENISLSIISVGPSNIDYLLKNIYAFNVDKVIRLNRENSQNLNSDIISNDIYSYIKGTEKYDIILLGKKGMLDGTSQIAYKLSNLLNYPLINNLSKIETTKTNSIFSIKYKTQNNIFSQNIKTPFIATVEDIENTFLQVPTLKQKLAAKKKQIEIISQKNVKTNLITNDSFCFRENLKRKSKSYNFISKNETLKYLRDLINQAKKEKTQSNDISKYLKHRDIFCFNYHDTNIIFCHNNSMYYKYFVKWNIKQNNQIHLDVSDIDINEKNIKIYRKIYAENLTSIINISLGNDINKPISICSNDETFYKLISKLGNNEIRPSHLINNLNQLYIDDIETNNILIEKKVDTFSITENKVLIAIGRGILNKQILSEIENFAKENDVKIVGSRQAAMNNFIPLENMVGVSGKQISPNLLICLGVSGAPAFFEGVKKSKKIISINNDINAPIVENCDININLDIRELFETKD